MLLHLVQTLDHIRFCVCVCDVRTNRKKVINVRINISNTDPSPMNLSTDSLINGETKYIFNNDQKIINPNATLQNEKFRTMIYSTGKKINGNINTYACCGDIVPDGRHIHPPGKRVVTQGHVSAPVRRGQTQPSLYETRDSEL